jgi:hypothetical protein
MKTLAMTAFFTLVATFASCTRQEQMSETKQEADDDYLPTGSEVPRGTYFSDVFACALDITPSITYDQNDLILCQRDEHECKKTVALQVKGVPRSVYQIPGSHPMAKGDCKALNTRLVWMQGKYADPTRATKQNLHEVPGILGHEKFRYKSSSLLWTIDLFENTDWTAFNYPWSKALNSKTFGDGRRKNQEVLWVRESNTKLSTHSSLCPESYLKSGIYAVDVDPAFSNIDPNHVVKKRYVSVLASCVGDNITDVVVERLVEKGATPFDYATYLANEALRNVSPQNAFTGLTKSDWMHHVLTYQAAAGVSDGYLNELFINLKGNQPDISSLPSTPNAILLKCEDSLGKKELIYCVSKNRLLRDSLRDLGTYEEETIEQFALDYSSPTSIRFIEVRNSLGDMDEEERILIEQKKRGRETEDRVWKYVGPDISAVR